MPDQLTTQILDPDPSDAAVVGTVLGARGDIQFDEDGSVSTIADGQTEIDVSFLYEKVSDDYRFIENYIESPVADLKDVRCVVRKEDRKTTGFKVQLSSEHVPAGSIYRWHVKVRDSLQVTQPPESQPRYVLGGAFQALNSQLTLLSTLPVTDFGLGALNIADGDAFRTYIGAAATSDIGGPFVPTSRTITEGAGLAGNTYNLTINRTLAMGTPSTLSVSTANSVSGTTHSHAITSSSNPGAAAAILATDASGFLTIPRLTATGYLFVNNPTANLYLKDTSTGWQSASTTVLTPLPNNSMRSTSYTSGLVGWNVNAIGDAEFNNLRVRGEILASVFKVSELSATAGTFGVFFSAANLSADATTPTTLSTSFTFHAKNSDAGGMLFGVGDILRFKSWTGSGIADAWATVASRTNNGVSTTYSATLNSGSTNVTFNAGTAVVDYGPSGTGFITLSTDGTVGSSPNLTMATHAGTPWSGFTTLMRSGNLNGSYGYASNVYGVGIGQYGASDSWLTFDSTNGIRIGNNTTTFGQWDTNGGVTIGENNAGKSFITIDPINGLRLFGGASLRIVLSPDGSGFLANGYFSWDASGNVTIARNATIAGWTIGNGSISSTGINITSGASAALAFGSTPPTSATAGTGIWLDRTGLYSLSSNTQNVVLDSTGLASGDVKLSATGFTVNATSAFSAAKALRWQLSGSDRATVYGTGDSTNAGVGLWALRPAGSSTGVADVFVSTPTVSSITLLRVQEVSGVGSVSVGTSGSGTSFSGFVIGNYLASPSHMLDVYGATFLANSTEPATPTGGGVIYVESGTLKYKGSSGTVTPLGVP